MPNGWSLCPAGTQVNTERATTGVAVTPDGQGVYAVTSGIFDEAVESINVNTLVASPTPVSAAYQGVAADNSGHVWASSGPENEVFEYLAASPGAPLVDARQAGPAPQEPNRGIPVTGYPGTILPAGGPASPDYSRLFVAGTLSVPQSVVSSAQGGNCPASDNPPGSTDPICAVVNVIDNAADPTATPTVHAIPVGRDAYGLAFLPSEANSTSGTLYVSNWADQTNPFRTGAASLQDATGTVSLVTVNPDGSGKERQVVDVGKAPAGMALSPSGNLLVVANSNDDTLSAIPIDPVSGNPNGAIQTVPVGLGGPVGTQPMAVRFSADGRHVFVALAGLNAIEVLAVNGESIAPISQSNLSISYQGTSQNVTSPATYIPTGWWPDMLATGPEGSLSSLTGYRLYVSNLKGNGAGPGYYGQLQPTAGTGTEGTVSAIDIPSDPTAFATDMSQWTTDVVQGDALAPVFSPGLASSDPAQNPCLDQTNPSQPAVAVPGSLLCQASLYNAGKSSAPVGAQGQTLTPQTTHVVFILAENKTFDSYFGDTGATLNSNADPSFNEYPLPVTTNQHNLAQKFTLFDNFWNEGAESSVVGHSWWSAGVTTPDRELSWGQEYDQGLRGGRGSGEYAIGSSPNVQAASLSGVHDNAVAAQESLMENPYLTLADNAAASGLSTRVYATDVSPVSSSASQNNQVCMPAWGENGSTQNCSTAGPAPVNPTPGSDLGFPDSDRADIFLHGQTPVSHAWDVTEGAPPKSFGQRFPSTPLPPSYTLDGWTTEYNKCMSGGGSDTTCQAQSMPNDIYMTLPENHTYDVSNVFNPLNPTPQSMVADNDYGIGKIIAGLSHSPFWKNTIVFLSEDDNQFTGDHVDIHRTFLLSMGGLANQLGPTGHVSDELGSFPSALKTAEGLLGLPPLTLFDWRAAPLQDAVASVSGTNDTIYDAVTPATPFLGGYPQTSQPGGVVAGAGNSVPPPAGPVSPPAPVPSLPVPDLSTLAGIFGY